MQDLIINSLLTQIELKQLEINKLSTLICILERQQIELKQELDNQKKEIISNESSE